MGKLIVPQEVKEEKRKSWIKQGKLAWVVTFLLFVLIISLIF